MDMAKNTPKVSIIIAAYNVEKYLPQCVDSIINQTYQNMEIIIVDDGSTDKSGEIGQNYARKDPRVKYVFQENQGLSAARNKGIESATGEWIGFVDGDDWIEPDMFGSLVRAAEEKGGDIVASGCFINWKDKSDTRYDSGEIVVLNGKEDIMRGYKKHYDMMVWNKLYHRTFWSTGYRFPKGKKHEDLDALYEMFMNGKTLICLKKPFYHYRQRKGSIIHSGNMQALIDVWEIRRTRFDEIGDDLPEDLKRRLLTARCNIAFNIWDEFAVKYRRERKKHEALLEEISGYCKDHYGEVKRIRVPNTIKIYYWVMSHNNFLSYHIIHFISCVRKLMGMDRDCFQRKRGLYE